MWSESALSPQPPTPNSAYCGKEGMWRISVVVLSRAQHTPADSTEPPPLFPCSIRAHQGGGGGSQDLACAQAAVARGG